MSDEGINKVAGTTPRSVAWAAARRRIIELVIVFVGVYAAFLLNRFDTDRRDDLRRKQILDALEHEFCETAHELKTSLDEVGPLVADFDHQLAAGEMPPLSIAFTETGYSASDDAAFLQAGGLELLDIQTVQLLHEVNAMQRNLAASLHDKAEISLAELVNHENADFYDPATRQLKTRYTWYPRLQHDLLDQAKMLLKAEEKLVAHVRAAGSAHFDHS